MFRKVAASLPLRSPAGAGVQQQIDRSSLPQPRQIKRFWKKATVHEAAGGAHGFSVHLDGRLLKTSSRQAMTLPSRSLALLVASEWEAQKEFLESHTMPMTTLASAAIDGPWLENRKHEQVVGQVMSYLKTDTVCFPQSSPDELVELQDKLWRPLVSWAEEHFKIKFAVNADDAIILAPHPPETVKTLSDYVSKLNSWELIGFEHAVRASKSVIIPLALNHRVVSVDQAADAARAEVLYQIGRWGEVEDSHDVDNEDIRVRLGSSVLFSRMLTYP